jgi:hypothetical protein
MVTRQSCAAAAKLPPAQRAVATVTVTVSACATLSAGTVHRPRRPAGRQPVSVARDHTSAECAMGPLWRSKDRCLPTVHCRSAGSGGGGTGRAECLP